MVTDFSVAEKARGVKFCVRVGLLSGQVFSHFGNQRSKVKVTRDKKCTSRCQDPPSLHTNGMRWLQAAGSTSVTQQWMSAFPGGRGVTACSDARSGFGVTHVVRRAFRTGGGSVWWDLCIASLLMHLFLCCLFSVSFAGQILTFM